MRSKGNGVCSQSTLKVSSCNLRTKLSLGLNCYLYRGLYTYKTSTRSHSTSGTNGAKYLTCIYLDSEYQYTALPIIFIVLCQRITKGRENNQRVPGMATHNLNSPISV